MKKMYTYLMIVTLFSFGIVIMLYLGYVNSNVSIGTLQLTSENGVFNDLKTLILNQFHHPLALLLTQIIVIMIATRIFGFIATKVLLPIVVGEIIAGIILGPSFLSSMLPAFSETLFPKSSLGNLSMISQLGLIFFMFVIGMELDWDSLKSKTKESVVISHSSILFPFFLGVGLALFLYSSFAPENVSFIPFALFMGIAMSITAFPVLAKIVKERNISNTSYGAMSLTCAAADDATGWYILAIIIAISSSTSLGASALSLGLIVAYMLIMIYLIKPFLAWFAARYKDDTTLNMSMVAIILIVLLLSSLATEIIGIHALFGAFIAGVIMPSNKDSKLREMLIPKIEYVSVLVLLPLFFALTGLRTQIGLMETSYHWYICGIIIIVAIAGKLLGAALSSKFMGFSWSDSFRIGALMNTRGLMELIVLNIGFELGILSAELFAMFVIMALVTTAMTGPLLHLIDKIKK
ncbi:cation:proton antiporter [Aliarcobacter lanthieri]|uniref:cation:proton antiporter domain-containing protein n=1 Tax=Aliarcobacter lanthieri TaxID=1355374 RepID=UPI001D175118|nr:cation:proton antiporter [Aliarcobacter lanthieri]QKF59322.1 cation:proton antiporter [Aliarcobacter lanthieri]